MRLSRDSRPTVCPFDGRPLRIGLLTGPDHPFYTPLESLSLTVSCDMEGVYPWGVKKARKTIGCTRSGTYRADIASQSNTENGRMSEEDENISGFVSSPPMSVAKVLSWKEGFPMHRIVRHACSRHRGGAAIERRGPENTGPWIVICTSVYWKF